MKPLLPRNMAAKKGFVRRRMDIESGGGEIGKGASAEAQAHLKRLCLSSMQVPIFPIRRHRKNRIPLKTEFINGGGAEGAGGKFLLFLPVTAGFFRFWAKIRYSQPG